MFRVNRLSISSHSYIALLVFYLPTCSFWCVMNQLVAQWRTVTRACLTLIFSRRIFVKERFLDFWIAFVKSYSLHINFVEEHFWKRLYLEDSMVVPLAKRTCGATFLQPEVLINLSPPWGWRTCFHINSLVRLLKMPAADMNRSLHGTAFKQLLVNQWLYYSYRSFEIFTKSICFISESSVDNFTMFN